MNDAYKILFSELIDRKFDMNSKKERELFFQQKDTLDKFLERGAISQAQYDKSYGDLVAKMGMDEIAGKSGKLKAYFAGGCFWCITPVYKAYGVDKVVCGYSGGDEPNPRYEDVKAQKTGHRETIMVEYDPKKVSYSKLLEIFLANVDPYDAEGQFIDKGFSYTLAVYYTSEEERKLARGRINEFEAASGRKVHIALEPFKSFYEAEDYHQDYYLKNPEAFEKEMKESGRRRS